MTEIRIKRTTTANNVPPLLEAGELAAGLADHPSKLWVGVPTSLDPSGMINVLAGQKTEKVFEVLYLGQTINVAWVLANYSATPAINTQGADWDVPNKAYTPKVPGIYKFEAYSPSVQHTHIIKNGTKNTMNGNILCIAASIGTHQFTTILSPMNGTTDFVATWLYTPNWETFAAVGRFTVFRLP